MKKMIAEFACSCSRKKKRDFCNTDNCPVFKEFTDISSLRDYVSLGMAEIKVSFKVKEKKNERCCLFELVYYRSVIC